MSNAYKMRDPEGIYFLTFTVVGWIDIFSRKVYRDLMIDNIKFCQHNKGLIIHSWVIMTNHIHLISSAGEKPSLTDIVRDLKKFTSREIIKLIADENESRKDWMLRYFGWRGRTNPNNTDYQFWIQDSHPIPLYTNDVMQQKVDYIHYNPVKAGFVDEPHHWAYSSARDYIGQKGMLNLKIIE